MDDVRRIEATPEIAAALADIPAGGHALLTRQGEVVARLVPVPAETPVAISGTVIGPDGELRSTTVISEEEKARIRDIAKGPPGPIARELFAIRERSKHGAESWKDLRDAGRKW